MNPAVSSQLARLVTSISTNTIVIIFPSQKVLISVSVSNNLINFYLGSRKCPHCRHVSKSPAMLEKHMTRHQSLERKDSLCFLE